MQTATSLKWNPAQEDFIRKNWDKMQTNDMAAILGCSPSTIVNLEGTMNLDSRGIKKKKKSKASIDEYKSRFKKGQLLKLQIKVRRHKKFKMYEGVVIDKTDYFIVLEGVNSIRTSFNYSDFVSGNVKTIEEEL